MIKNLLLGFMFFCTTSFAQNPDWINYSNGNNINCILKDGNFIWLGTSDGVTRFNKITNVCDFYTKQNSDIACLYVNVIKKDAAGNIWIGTTGGGIAKFNGSSWQSYTTYNSQISSNFVDGLCIDKLGAVWVASMFGLDKFYNNAWSFFAYGGNFGSIESLEADSAGIIYAGSNSNGLGRFDGANWTVYVTSNSGIMNNRIHDIKIDSHNNVYCCAWNCGGPGGLTKFDGTSFTTYFLWTTIGKLSIDDSDNVWFINYSDSCLSKFDGITKVDYGSANTQILFPYEALIEDSGNIWYNDFKSNGLKKFDGIYNVLTYNVSAWNLSDNWIWKMATDQLGNLWLKTGKGIEKFDLSTFTLYDTINASFPANDANCLCTDQNNDLWIGTNSHGIVKFDGTSWTVYDSATYNLPGNYVYDVTADTIGNIYAYFMPYHNLNQQLVGGGISKFNGSNWTKVNLTTINDTSIFGMSVDKKNRLWVFGSGKIEIVDDTLHFIINSGNSPLSSTASASSVIFDSHNNAYLSCDFDHVYKVDSLFQFTSISITSCTGIIGDLVTPRCVDKNDNVWFTIIPICNSYSDYLVAKYDGSSVLILGLGNSGLSYMNVGQILNHENKLYFNQGNGFDQFSDSTLLTSFNNNLSNSNLSFKVFPNPISENKLNIVFQKNPVTNFTLDLFDVSGRKVFSQRLSLSKTQSVLLPQLSNGIYQAVIRDNDSRYNQKVVVMEK